MCMGTCLLISGVDQNGHGKDTQKICKPNMEVERRCKLKVLYRRFPVPYNWLASNASDLDLDKKVFKRNKILPRVPITEAKNDGVRGNRLSTKSVSTPTLFVQEYFKIK